MTIEQERSRFELAVTVQGLASDLLKRNSSGGYVSGFTASLWQVWLAAVGKG